MPLVRKVGFYFGFSVPRRVIRTVAERLGIYRGSSRGFVNGQCMVTDCPAFC